MATNRIIIFILLHGVMQGSQRNSSTEEIHGGRTRSGDTTSNLDSRSCSNASFSRGKLSPLTEAILEQINERNRLAIEQERKNPPPFFYVE